MDPLQSAGHKRGSHQAVHMGKMNPRPGDDAEVGAGLEAARPIVGRIAFHYCGGEAHLGSLAEAVLDQLAADALCIVLA